MRADGRCDQRLPDHECGQPSACELQAFTASAKAEVEAVREALEGLTGSAQDKETIRRIKGLHDLLNMPLGAAFDGKTCHCCGDALICVEAPPNHVIVTKNRKHFEPMAKTLGKPLLIAESPRTTRG